MKKKAQVIPPDAYPQMVSKSDAIKMARVLRAPETAARAARVIQDAGQKLRQGVHDYVRELEAATGNRQVIFEKAHEIRGFAETAGLRATGRIASGLCRYFEEMEKLETVPDNAVITLHVSAIVRAAHAKDEVNRAGDAVVKELAALVAHKLAEARAVIAG
jgi:preprotein translocase subunit Sec61beta